MQSNANMKRKSNVNINPMLKYVKSANLIILLKHVKRFIQLTYPWVDHNPQPDATHLLHAFLGQFHHGAPQFQRQVDG